MGGLKYYDMRDWVKYAVMIMVAAFAMASVAQIAQATIMDVQMSAPMDAGGGCADCPHESSGTGSSCTSDCLLSSVALPFPEVVDVILIHESSVILFRKTRLAGWRTPPDPFPPKYKS